MECPVNFFTDEEREKLKHFQEDRELLVVLGSSSASRMAVFQRWFPASLFFHTAKISPDIDEKAIRSNNPVDLTMEITKKKDAAVVEKYLKTNTLPQDYPRTVLFITSDQVSVYSTQGASEIREKPLSKEQNREFLRSYSNAMVETSGMVCVHRLDIELDERVSAERKTDLRSFEKDINRVYFRSISEDVIDRVVSRGDSMHCSGGFVVEDPDLSKCVKRVDGCIEGVMGLNPFLLKKMIIGIL